MTIEEMNEILKWNERFASAHTFRLPILNVINGEKELNYTTYFLRRVFPLANGRIGLSVIHFPTGLVQTKSLRVETFKELIETPFIHMYANDILGEKE